MTEKPAMNRNELLELHDEQLVTACIGPLLMRLRGTSDSSKADAYGELSPARQSLFLLRVLDGHARGSDWEYYIWTGMLLQSQEKWGGHTRCHPATGSRQAAGTAGAYSRIHRKHAAAPNLPAAPAASDLERNPELAMEICELHQQYTQHVQEAYRLAAIAIRLYPEEDADIHG